jgi:hypothetical protein
MGAKFLSLETSPTGSTWVPFGSASQATRLSVLNNTGTTLEFRREGEEAAIFQLPTGMAWTFTGIHNAAQINMRRVDQSNTQVTVYAEAEGP